MSSLIRSLTATKSSPTHVQSLRIRLGGITAGDYLTWVRDPEPPALDRGLRSVATSAELRGEVVNVKLVWTGQPPTTPSDAAAAAGFALTPEVVAVHSATWTADRRHRATAESRTDPGCFSEPVSHRASRRNARQLRPND
jgi:hypothetical protein